MRRRRHGNGHGPRTAQLTTADIPAWFVEQPPLHRFSTNLSCHHRTVRLISRSVMSVFAPPSSAARMIRDRTATPAEVCDAATTPRFVRVRSRSDNVRRSRTTSCNDRYWHPMVVSTTQDTSGRPVRLHPCEPSRSTRAEKSRSATALEIPVGPAQTPGAHRSSTTPVRDHCEVRVLGTRGPGIRRCVNRPSRTPNYV